MRTRFSSKQIGRQADDGSISGALRPNGRPDVGILCATAAGDRAELCAATGSARRRKFARGCGWRAVVEARRRWRLRAWTHKGRERQFLKARYRPQGIHTAWAPAKSREGAGEGAHLALRRQLLLFVKPGERERPPSRSGEDSFSRPRDFFPRSFPTPELRSDNHFVLSVTDDERRRRLLLPPIVLDADGDIEHKHASPTTRGPRPRISPASDISRFPRTFWHLVRSHSQHLAFDPIISPRTLHQPPLYPKHARRGRSNRTTRRTKPDQVSWLFAG